MSLKSVQKKMEPFIKRLKELREREKNNKNVSFTT